MHRNHLTPSLRDRLKRFPPPLDNYFGVVPFPPTEDVVSFGDAAPDHHAAMQALGRANALSQQYPNHFLISRVLVRKEAVASSDIEGTHSTLDALLEAEETNEEEASEADILVKDYAITLEAAITLVEDKSYDAFSLHTIQQLHRALMRNDKEYLKRHGSPGEFREKQVRIGGRDFNNSTYNPPPYTDVPACMEEHIAYLRSDGMQQLHQSVIVQMAVAHAHFEAVHPFADGNGRVGRLFLPLMLLAAGHTPLYLAPYIAAFKSDYYAALRDAQQRLNYAPLIAHLSRAITHTVTDAETAVRRLTELQSDWASRKKFRAKSAAQRMLDKLLWHPVVTAKSVERLARCSPAAARAALTQLTEAGVLLERTGKMRYRIFQAREVLKIYKNPNAEYDD